MSRDINLAQKDLTVDEVVGIKPEYWTRGQLKWSLTIEFRTEEAALSFFSAIPTVWKDWIDRSEVEKNEIRLIQNKHSPSRACNLTDKIEQLIGDRAELRIQLASIFTPEVATRGQKNRAL